MGGLVERREKREVACEALASAATRRGGGEKSQVVDWVGPAGRPADSGVPASTGNCQLLRVLTRPETGIDHVIFSLVCMVKSISIEKL